MNAGKHLIRKAAGDNQGQEKHLQLRRIEICRITDFISLGNIRESCIKRTGIGIEPALAIVLDCFLIFLQER